MIASYNVALIRLVCSCATQDFLKSKKFHIFCADLFRGYSGLPAKPNFGQINCNHTKIKSVRDYSCDKLSPKAASHSVYPQSDIWLQRYIYEKFSDVPKQCKT